MAFAKDLANDTLLEIIRAGVLQPVIPVGQNSEDAGRQTANFLKGLYSGLVSLYQEAQKQ